MPKTQGQIKELFQNRTNNNGVFFVEHELEFEGQKIISYLILPQKLASRADEVSDFVFSEAADVEEETESSESDESGTTATEKPKATKTKPPVKKAKSKK